MELIHSRAQLRGQTTFADEINGIETDFRLLVAAELGPVSDARLSR